jgi:ATP-binding cassette subfamily B protein
VVNAGVFHRRKIELKRKSTRIRDIFGNIFVSADPTVWAWTIGTVVFVILNGVLAGVAPLALKGVVDDLTHPQGLLVPARTLAIPVSIYVGALASQRAIEQVQTYLYSIAEQRLVRNFSTRTFGHILTLPLSVHLEWQSGALSQALTQGIFGIRLIATHLVLTAAPLLIQLVIAAVVLSDVLDRTLGGFLVAGLLLYCAAFAVGVARLHAPLDDLAAAQVDAGGLASDGLMNVEAIKAYTAERRFANRYDLLLGATERSWGMFSRRRLENGIIVSAVFAISCGTIFLISANLVAAGQMTLGGFVLVNAYVLQLVRPVEILGFAIRDIGQGLAYLKEIGGIGLVTDLRRSPERLELATGDRRDDQAHRRVQAGGGADCTDQRVTPRQGCIGFGDREVDAGQMGVTVSAI